MIQLFYYDEQFGEYKETTYSVETHGMSLNAAYEADLNWAVESALEFGDMIIIYPELKG